MRDGGLPPGDRAPGGALPNGRVRPLENGAARLLRLDIGRLGERTVGGHLAGG